MKKCLLTFCLMLLLVLLVGIQPAMGADYDPISTTGSCAPKAMTGPQTVTVTITVRNGGDATLTQPVKLYDPNGSQVAFTNGSNAVTLKQQERVTYVGDWAVTADELAAGKIKYKLSYAVYDEDGNAKGTSRVISVPIQKTVPTAKVTADYTVAPTMAAKGQKVTLTYTVSNVGNVDAENIVITNPNLTDKKITIARLPAGEQAVETFEYTMGSKTIKFKPKVTYKAVGSTKVTSITNMAQKTIDLAKGDVTVNLKATGATTALPGAPITLTCTITNKSNVTYTDVLISDPQLGQIASGVELKAKTGTYTVEKVIAVEEVTDYAFTVTGQSASGQTLELTSNAIHVVAIDVNKILQLEVSAEAETLSIRENPAEMVFTITVKNIGNVPGKNLAVKASGTTIETIPELAAGEEIAITKLVAVSMAGKFMFTVSGVDEQGTTQSFDTNILQVIQLDPTPEPPPPTQAPTEAPEGMQVEPTDTPPPTIPAANRDTTDGSGTGGGGMTLLYIMAGLLVLLLVAVLAMVVLSRRRRAQEEAEAEAAVDTFERGARRGYATPQRRTRTSRGAPERTDEADASDEMEVLDEIPVVTPARYARPEPAQAAPTADPDAEPDDAGQYRLTRKERSAYAPPAGSTYTEAGNTQYQRRSRRT